ncbi:hypothetical protein APUTEX25_004347 [Auxenochlorella protothecoides]|uniref:protein-tyrosine sulfotransferase n=1 Tax=Auxenochlorella protothecoides TaxID=3075 RepID=A0A3M7KZH5_AUXPR|nr:hypothetical protein APUTEX25_004347 [Auxenochlorella protothecoides]|eukprot:RMZ55923.1 hypothetical protein APUTEX25_004347 [Auxenochlorella protothecoides]
MLCACILAALLWQAGCQRIGSVTELQDSVARLERELARAPDADRPAASLRLALALHQLDSAAPDGRTRVPRAAELYRAVARGTDDDAGRAVVLGNLGALLLGAEDAEGARAALTESQALCRGLLDGGASRPVTLEEQCTGNEFNLAKLLQTLGDAEGAEAVLRSRLLTRAALERTPALYAKAAAALPTYTAADAVAFEEVAGPLRDSSPTRGPLAGLEAYDRAWIHYALFRAHREQGAYERAWRHLEQANSLQDSKDAGDGNLASNLQTLTAVFGGQATGSGPQQAAWRALVRGARGTQDATPIFIVGLPRSGSSLAEAILAAHPQVWGAGEDGALAPLLPDLLALLQSGDWLRPGSRKVQAIARRYLDAMRSRVPQSRKNVTHIVDKMLFNSWNLGFISMLFPNACIVHVERHPADTVLSCFAQSFERRGILWANNLTRIVDQHIQTQRVMALWERVLPPGRVYRLRYEDVVRDGEVASRGLLRACGLAWDPAVLGFHASQGRSVATASALQVRQPLHARAVGAWRRFAPWLAPALRPLRHDVAAYEAAAGLPSSAPLLDDEVLGGGAVQKDGVEGGAARDEQADASAARNEQADASAARDEL